MAVAVLARLQLELVDALLRLFFLADLFGGEDVEDGARYVMLVEVYFVRLAALLAETGWRVIDDLHNSVSFCIFVFHSLELLIELNELELDIVEDIELLVIEQFLLIIDPDIFEVDVVQIVENLLYLVLVLEFGDRGEFFVFFVFEVVLAGDWIVQEESAVLWLEGGVEAGLVAEGSLIDGLEVVGDEFLVLLEVGELLLEE